MLPPQKNSFLFLFLFLGEGVKILVNITMQQLIKPSELPQ